MVPNLYLYEKALEVHHQDLRHEMEAKRLFARLPKRTGWSRRTAGKLGVLLLKLGAWLKQFESHPYNDASVPDYAQQGYKEVMEQPGTAFEDQVSAR